MPTWTPDPANNTPNVGLPRPKDSDLLGDTPEFVSKLADELDKGKIPKFATSAARNAALPAPVAGSLAWCLDAAPVARLTVYDGTTWQRVYPPATVVTSGTVTPTAPAEAGAIYIQY